MSFPSLHCAGGGRAAGRRASVEQSDLPFAVSVDVKAPFGGKGGLKLSAQHSEYMQYRKQGVNRDSAARKAGLCGAKAPGGVAEIRSKPANASVERGDGDRSVQLMGSVIGPGRGQVHSNPNIGRHFRAVSKRKRKSPAHGRRYYDRGSSSFLSGP